MRRAVAAADGQHVKHEPRHARGHAGAGEAHAARRYHTLLQSGRSGEIKIKHVPDATNPADFLTKWVGGPKLSRSLSFVTNAVHRACDEPPL